jgi:hypothetical protein
LVDRLRLHRVKVVAKYDLATAPVQ